MPDEGFTKIGHLKDVAAFKAHLAELHLDLPVDRAALSAAEGSPLAAPISVAGRTVGNRWCVHPMEGWDANADGTPSEHTIRRWRNFGRSGAKLIWGGEAFAVHESARANPNQLAIVNGDTARAEKGVRHLLHELVDAHHAAFGANADDLLVGLQLTHSGRFCRPFDKKRLEPRIAYHHPLLDPKFGIRGDDDSVLLSDDQVERIIDGYVVAARLAHRAGFHFVDVKQCHGYLGHEFLSAFTRKGKFGGDLAGRTRFAREIIGRIQSECPGLQVGVRLSIFDHPSFRPDPARATTGKLGPGIPDDYAPFLPYRYGFGCDPDRPLEIDLREPIQYVLALVAMGVRLINVSCCSPYYNPHFQRPAIFPPSDGYQPPEDPLVGVHRQIQATRQLKAACPDAIVVGTGYSYLQEYLPHVAQGAVRNGWADFVGIGRLALSYWDMPAHALSARPMEAKRLCRTFSDCTTAPRNGIISGCYPLDDHYKNATEHAELKAAKAELRKRLMTRPATSHRSPSSGR